MAIDDTGSLKPHADKTEDVSYQYCPATKDETYTSQISNLNGSKIIATADF